MSVNKAINLDNLDVFKECLESEIGDIAEGKVDKVAGMGLSENDYTDADKAKLAGLENYDDATSTTAGLVGIGAQTFAGDKSFNGKVLPNGASDCATAQARKLSSGTAEASSSNCAAGYWYGQYE